MFKQIKEMISDNKQLLLGGIASSLIYYGNFMVRDQPWYPAILKDQLDPHLPPNGDLITAIAPPVALYSVVKYGKKKNLEDLADGSILFGVPNIVSRTMVQSLYAEGKAVAPVVKIPASITSKYLQNASMNRPIAPVSSISKYVLTS